MNSPSLPFVTRTDWARTSVNFLPVRQKSTPEAFTLFGVQVLNVKLDQAVEELLERCKNRVRTQVAFVNTDCLNKVWQDQGYRRVLNDFDRVYADGSGIKLASYIFGWNLLDNVNGTDMFPKLCQGLAFQGGSLFLLGARSGVAEDCGLAMQALYPGLKIAGIQHGYFPASSTHDVVQKINASGADVLLVAFGAPHQERWLAEHADQLKPSIRIGVGGLFDFYSGRVSRAPIWLRRMGMEWIWRLMQEPIRMWRRYLLGNPLFVMRVLWVRLHFIFSNNVYQKGVL